MSLNEFEVEGLKVKIREIIEEEFQERIEDLENEVERLKGPITPDEDEAPTEPSEKQDPAPKPKEDELDVPEDEADEEDKWD